METRVDAYITFQKMYLKKDSITSLNPLINKIKKFFQLSALTIIESK